MEAHRFGALQADQIRMQRGSPSGFVVNDCAMPVVSFGEPSEALLVEARDAGDPMRRVKAATRGLSQPRLLPDTQTLLLRQLYLGQLHAEQFAAAAQSAEQMVELGEMPAVARADAARAWLALGDFSRAVRHQRLAAREAPASLRAVQYARLSRLLRFAGESQQVLSALKQAERWATWDRPLYRAEIVLTLADAGEAVGLGAAYETLATEMPDAAMAYYLGAELALRLKEVAVASGLYRDFANRVERLPLVERVSLTAERAHARRQLSAFAKASV